METDIIYNIDALSGLRRLPDNSVDCIVTSPPHWQMRDYDIAPIVWGGAERCEHHFDINGYCSDCGGWLGQLCCLCSIGVGALLLSHRTKLTSQCIRNDWWKRLSKPDVRQVALCLTLLWAAGPPRLSPENDDITLGLKQALITSIYVQSDSMKLFEQTPFKHYLNGVCVVCGIFIAFRFIEQITNRFYFAHTSFWRLYADHYPLAAFACTADSPAEPFSLFFEDRDGVEGLHAYWDGEADCLNRSRRLTLYLKLYPQEVEELLFPSFSAGAGFRALYRLVIDGEPTLCRLEEIADYNPSAVSTRCVFVTDV